MTNELLSVKIEKGIPVSHKGKECYPYEKMEVGDSFFVPVVEGRKISSIQAQVHSGAKSFTMRNRKNWVFTTRRENNGIRIWRIK